MNDKFKTYLREGLMDGVKWTHEPTNEHGFLTFLSDCKDEDKAGDWFQDVIKDMVKGGWKKGKYITRDGRTDKHEAQMMEKGNVEIEVLLKYNYNSGKYSVAFNDRI